MRAKEKTIIAVTVASHALTHVAEQAFPAVALLVSLRFLGKVDYEQIGRANFIATFLFGLAALPSGWLVDRLGARRMLLIFLFGTGLSLISLSLMPTFAAFTAGLALMGFFAGLYHPAGLTMISRGLEQHGRAMGAHGMGGNLGLAVTPALAAFLAQRLGWDKAYLVLGILPIVLGMLVLAGRVKVERDAPEKKGEEDKGDNSRPVLLIPLIILFAMGVFNGMTYRGALTFLPAYFAERVHASWLPLGEVAVGGTMTTAILLLGIAGQFLGGRLADRFRKERLFTAIFFISAPVLFALGLLSGLPLVLATGLFAFLYFANQPVGNSILPRYSSPRVQGTVFGLFFFVNFGAGSVMSWIAGVVGERFDLSSIFHMLAVTLVAAASLGLVLSARTRNLP